MPAQGFGQQCQALSWESIEVGVIIARGVCDESLIVHAELHS